MSKSIYNTFDCSSKAGCASKSLLYINNASSSTSSVSQFITTQTSSGGGGGGGGGGITGTIDNLTITGNLTVEGTANINKTITNNLTVTQTLTTSVIESVGNLVLQPTNPTPCTGFVQINDNLQVNGCFTELCTTDTYILDPVPTLNSCNNGALLVDDDNDIGFQFPYIVPNTSSQNTGFFGFDRMRFPTVGPRFAFWYNTTQVNPPNQEYQRFGTLANGVDIDTLYTYLIKNPDDPNAPASIPGGHLKIDIGIDTSNNLNVAVTNQELHDVGSYELHSVGTLNSTQAGFRVADVNQACNYIELGKSTIIGFEANVTGNDGIYLSHVSLINIRACTSGVVRLGPQVGTTNGSFVNFIDDVSIQAGNRLLTNTINEKSTNLTIQTVASGHNIDITSINQNNITSANQTLITATNAANGTIELESNGFQNLAYTRSNGGIENFDTGIFLHTNNNHSIVLDAQTSGNILLYSQTGSINTDASQSYFWAGDLMSIMTYNNNSSVNVGTDGTSANVNIETSGTTSNINLLTNSTGNILETTTNGNIILSANPVTNAGGGGNLVEVSPGLLFNNTNISGNPSTGTNRQRTIWFDNIGGNFTNFKTYYPNDSIDYAFVLSASENVSGVAGQLALYHDATGWSIAASGITASGGSLFGIVDINMSGNINGTNNINMTGNINGVDNITMSGNLSVDNIIMTGNINGVTISAGSLSGVNNITMSGNLNLTAGTITGTNVNNDLAASGLIFQAAGGGPNYFYQDDTTIPIANTDQFRIMYLNGTGAGSIGLIAEPTIASTSLSYNGTSVVWAAPPATTANLQDIYNNSTTPPNATITLNNTSINNQLTITHLAGYPVRTVFEVTNNSGNPYFRTSKVDATDGTILIGNNPNLAIPVNIAYGTLNLQSSQTTADNFIMQVIDNNSTNIFQINENPTVGTGTVIINAANNSNDVPILKVLDNNGTSVFEVLENATTTLATVLMKSANNTANVPILRVQDNNTNDIFQVYENPGTTDRFVLISASTNTNDVSVLEVRDNTTNSILNVNSNPTTTPYVQIQAVNVTNTNILSVLNSSAVDLFQIVNNPAIGTDPTIIIQPQDATLGDIALAIQNNGSVNMITFTPNQAKIANFAGDVTITGTIDPIGVNFTGLINSTTLNPVVPNIGDGTIYVRTAENSGTPLLPFSSLTFIESSTSIVSTVERPVMIYDDTTTTGGYYSQPIVGSIPIFSNVYGNRLQSSSITLSSATNSMTFAEELTGPTPTSGFGSIWVNGNPTINQLYYTSETSSNPVVVSQPTTTPDTTVAIYSTNAGNLIAQTGVTITGTNSDIITYGNTVGSVQIVNAVDSTVNVDAETVYITGTLTVNITITLPTVVVGQKLYLIADPVFGGFTITISGTTIPAIAPLTVRTAYTFIGVNATWYILSTQI